MEAFCSLGKFRGQAPFVHWLRKVATRVGYRFWKEEDVARIQEAIFGDRQFDE